MKLSLSLEVSGVALYQLDKNGAALISRVCWFRCQSADETVDTCHHGANSESLCIKQLVEPSVKIRDRLFIELKELQRAC